MTTSLIDSTATTTGDAALPYTYDFSFAQGPGAWTTWLQPSVVTGDSGAYTDYTNLRLPGNVDPNHLDGVGALWLVSHLSTPALGSPGILNLANAKIDITIRGENFDPNGAKLVFWIASYLPDGQVSGGYYAGLQVTNWAFTGDDLASQVTSDWQTLTVTLDTDPADWTYSGINFSGQGDWANRYAYMPLDQALSNVDATLHLVLISDSPSTMPTGALDIENITISTATPATPSPLQTSVAPQIVQGLENTTITGTVTGGQSMGGTLTYTIVSNSVQNGTATLDSATGNFTFTPTTNYYGPTDFNGPAQFQYTVSDGTTTSGPKTVFFQIGPVAQIPITYAGNENIEIAANASFNYTLYSGSDPNSSTLQYSLRTPLSFVLVENSVTNGTLTLDSTSGRYTFTPTAGFSGTASFQYQVTNGVNSSTAKTVTITVDPAGVTPPVPTYNQVLDYFSAGNTAAFAYWIPRLADAGDPNAAYHYGMMLTAGSYNITRNTQLAAQYLSAAINTVPDARLQLADLYIAGDGVTRNFGAAAALLQAMPNNATALYKLGLLAEGGSITAPGGASAASYYVRAATLGNVDAMYTLGRRYLLGSGVTQNYAAAYFWLNTALKYGGGGPGLAQFIQLLQYDAGIAAGALSSDQVNAISQQVASWQPGSSAPFENLTSGTSTNTQSGTFYGAPYQYIDNSYNIAGLLTRQTYRDSNGNVVGYETFDPSGGYVIYAGGIQQLSYQPGLSADSTTTVLSPGSIEGVSYASRGIHYTSLGSIDSETFYDSTGAIVANISYNILGYDLYIGGSIYQSNRLIDNGERYITYYNSGSFYGNSYSYYANHYSSDGFRDRQIFYDNSGTPVAQTIYSQDGSFYIYSGSSLILSRSYASDGGYTYTYSDPGNINGVSYNYYTDGYDSANFRDERSFYDQSGTNVASWAFGQNGSYSITALGAVVEQKSVMSDGSYLYFSAPTGVPYLNEYDSFDSNGQRFAQVINYADHSQTILSASSLSLELGAGTDTVTFGQQTYTAQVSKSGLVDLSAASDTYLKFDAGLGFESIYSFSPTGPGQDHLLFSKDVFSDWAHLLDATTQVGNDIQINMSSTDIVTIKNLTMSAFQQSDVKFY